MSVLLALTILGFALSTTQVVLLSLVLLFIFYTYYIHTGYNSSNPLVFSIVPHLRSAALFGADPNSFLRQCQKSYGSIFTLNLGGRYMTFVTDPRCYPLITKARDGLSFAQVAVGVSMQVLGTAEENAKDEKIDELVHAQYAQYLNGQELDNITQAFQENIHSWFSQHLERIEKKGSATKSIESGLLELVTQAIFSASTRSLFGDLLVDEHMNPNPGMDSNFSDNFYAPKELLKNFQEFDAVFPMLYGGLPHFLLKKGVAARDRMVNTLSTLRNGACAWYVQRQDTMVENPPTKRPKTDLQAFGASQLGQLWALQGNTIPATFWTIYFLSQQPETLARVQAEIQSVCDSDGKVDKDGLKKLTLLDQAFNETLRLATGSMMMRRATKDIVLDLPTGPLSLKAGANIAIYPYLSHHDSTLFPNPDEFDLKRWDNKPLESSMITDIHGEKIPSAYLPFGAGISTCPGRHFARNEIKIAVIAFLQRFTLDTREKIPHPGYLLSRAGLGIFPPAKDVKVKFEKREKA